ncbi:N-acetylglucosamine kinase [Streptomyces lavendulae]|uniref:BadF/BadG/BcrA/BcrD ATPase family protein n=1 Tax=Streptomyces lavendulae subsp. lavendulae TaxID=58340 RepID=A0A2K8P6U1_STRLA|nr:BadF/BadG/BcrA/BcrD ATPase family protein [Streptomyces lavendulae]ATZ22464.1 BadF/BadG/BcrA/BcrD ATPase family protein [Streptomyces lavendulae subsp. lavendulae]QUQ52308.1 N-acetylmuramic acid/N-acetylglucosamine kinase [Streptomyces lavendulae subsp. lavendulae]
MTLVLGIDGGGSTLRAAVADARGGPPLAMSAAGAGNARSVPETVLAERLAQVVAEAVPPGRAADVRCVVAGFAGSGVPGRAGDRGQGVAGRALSAALLRNGVTGARVRVAADSEIAFAGAPGTPPDGLVVISGTGAAAARMRDHRLAATADGCGWLTGDDGSGFWIAREGVRRALRAADGRGPATLLVDRLAEAFDAPAADPVSVRFALVDGALAASGPALARYCPVVVGAAVDGDAVAGRILDEAADLLAESARALRPRHGEPLVTAGGLLGRRGPLLERFTRRASRWELVPHPVRDGLAGAVALARTLPLQP